MRGEEPHSLPGTRSHKAVAAPDKQASAGPAGVGPAVRKRQGDEENLGKGGCLGPLAQMRVPTGSTVTPPSCLGLYTPPINILKHRKTRPRCLKESSHPLATPKRGGVGTEARCRWHILLGLASWGRRPVNPSLLPHPSLPSPRPTGDWGFTATWHPTPSPQNLTFV